MALYFYFNEATGDLVYSDQASYARESYTALGEQTDMDPKANGDWVYNSNRSSIRTVSKDPASGRIVGLTSMSYMFQNCSSLTFLDLSGFDTSQVSEMNYIFGSCSSLTSLDLSGFDTSRMTNMDYIFKNCTSLASLDISGFDTSKLAHIDGVFANTPLLARIHIGPGYTIGMPEPGSSVAGRDGNWHAIGGASYSPGSVPRVDAVYYAAADLVPDGSLLVNLEDLKAALANRGGLPFTKDTVIAESEGKPVWSYMTDCGNGLPGFAVHLDQGEAWIRTTLDCRDIWIEGNDPTASSGHKRMALGMIFKFGRPTIVFAEDAATASLTYQDGMPVLTAMDETGPIMAGDHPYGFAAYATDTDFMDYVFALE